MENVIEFIDWIAKNPAIAFVTLFIVAMIVILIFMRLFSDWDRIIR